MKELSVIKKHFINYVIVGSLWILGWLFSAFSDNIICSIFSVVFNVAAVACLLYSLLAKQESDDEMSIKNLQKAKAKGFERLIGVTLIMALIKAVCSLFEIEVLKNAGEIYQLALGLAFIYVGLMFLKYEKDGE